MQHFSNKGKHMLVSNQNLYKEVKFLIINKFEMRVPYNHVI